MKTGKLTCVVCGADITRSMKFYPNGYRGGAYCYECNEKHKSAVSAERAARKVLMNDADRIVFLYKEGKRVSQISEIMGLPASEVYQILCIRLEDE